MAIIPASIMKKTIAQKSTAISGNTKITGERLLTGQIDNRSSACPVA
jgi:hypothetical protein